MPKILIIDDEDSILNLLRIQFQIEGLDVITASTGREGMNQLKLHPDLVVLDLMLPDKSGYDVLKEIRKQDEMIPVIMLTALDGMNEKIIGLQSGADDYLTKPFNGVELVLKVRRLLKRIQPTHKQKTIGPFVHNENERIIYLEESPLALTYREYELMRLLIHHPNRVFTRDELSRLVWGYDYLGETRAVDLMIQRIRKKIVPYQSYIQTVYGVGYRIGKP